MSKNRKNSIDKESHRRYLENQMTPHERNEYERLLQKDRFAADAADGFASLKADELKSDLAKLDERIQKRTRPARRLNLYAYAAASIIIVVVSTFLLTKEVRQPNMVLSDYVPELSRKVDSVADEEVEKVEKVEKVEGIEGKVENPPSLKLAPSPGYGAQSRRAEVEGEVEEKVEKVEEVEEVEKVERVEGVVEGVRVTEEKIPVVVREISAPARAESPAMEKKLLAEPAMSAPSKSKAETSKKADIQIRAITGKVVSSEDGEPIPGVSITLQGKVAGVVTDIDGIFKINVDSSDILRVNYIGMKSLEIPAAIASSEKIVMDPDFMALEEVVVTAFGTKTTRQSTGSVTVIDLAKDEGLSDYTSAMPVGGFDNFRKYIDENGRFPEDYSGSGREVVRLKFLLDVYGNISEIEIIRTPGEYFSFEAKRLLMEGPAWSPAKMDSTPVTGKVTIRIIFTANQ